MIYDLRKLCGDEVGVLKMMIQKYKQFERLDILIMMTLKKLGISPSEFLTRETEQKETIEVIPIIQNMDESLKYCDGDKCTINLFKSC